MRLLINAFFLLPLFTPQNNAAACKIGSIILEHNIIRCKHVLLNFITTNVKWHPHVRIQFWYSIFQLGLWLYTVTWCGCTYRSVWFYLRMKIMVAAEREWNPKTSPMCAYIHMYFSSPTITVNYFVVPE